MAALPTRLLRDVPARLGTVCRSQTAHQCVAAGCGRAGGERISVRPRSHRARPRVRRHHPQQHGRRRRPRFRPGLPLCVERDDDPSEPPGRGLDSVFERRVRVAGIGRWRDHRVQPHAAEEEPRFPRADSRQERARDRLPDLAAGHYEGPPDDIQSRYAGGQGSTVRRRLPVERIAPDDVRGDRIDPPQPGQAGGGRGGKLGGGDGPGRSAGARRHAVSPGAPDCRPFRFGKRAHRQEAIGLDGGTDAALRAGVHGRVRGTAERGEGHGHSRDSRRHRALVRGTSARARQTGTGTTNFMTKAYRQGQMLKLVRSKRISTQEELAQELKAQDIAATQVTLSRDIRDLRLVKTRDGYQEMAPEETGPGFSLLATEFLKDVLRAQNLVVLKTSPGHANSVAVALDNEGWPEVIGTIAGDDTILVITADGPTGEAVQEKLLNLVERG